MLIFFIIAAIWLLIVNISFRKLSGQKKKRDKRFLLGGLALFLVLAALIFIGSFVFEIVESSEFCGTQCHVMEPYHESYEDPENNQIMTIHNENDITCANCHDRPYLDGKIYSLSLALPELIIYYTDSYDPDDLGGHVANDACTKCHDGDHALEPQNILTALNTTEAHPTEGECASCHAPHQEGIGLSEEACLECHGLGTNNFKANIEAHGIRTEEECMSCHDRKHPEEAKIPFSDSAVVDLIDADFCSDCHQQQFTGYSAWPLDKTEVYSDCTTSCHQEHKTIANIPIHNTTLEPFIDNCDKCHSDIISHNFYNVSYSAQIETINNDFCSSCHEPIYTIFDPEIGECTDCHLDHGEKPIPDHPTSSPFDECDKCHSEFIDKHDLDLENVEYKSFPATDISNDFCSNCHTDEYESLADGVHSSKDCIDCHNEHRTIVPNFAECQNCHKDIPDDHVDSCTQTCHHDTSVIHS
jgi:hypothetical protein